MNEFRDRAVDAIQSDEYAFPYHYIPSRSPGIRFSRQWSWSPSYLAALELFEAWLDSAIQMENHRHVDIGCGDGALINNLDRGKYRTLSVLGVDYDERAIEWAKMFGSASEFQQKSISDLPSGGFESASLVEVIEHIPPNETAHFISEVADVLVPGGKLFVTVPSTQKRLTAKHYRHFDFDSISQLFAPQFRIIECSGFEKYSIWSRILLRVMRSRWHYLEIYGANSFLCRDLTNRHLDPRGCGRILLTLEKR